MHKIVYRAKFLLGLETWMNQLDRIMEKNGFGNTLCFSLNHLSSKRLSNMSFNLGLIKCDQKVDKQLAQEF